MRCCNDDCKRTEESGLKISCRRCGSLCHADCINRMEGYSFSCLEKRKKDESNGIPAQKLFPCATCKFDVNSDKKCSICDKAMHVFCSVVELVDGGGDAVCKYCSIKTNGKPLEIPPTENPLEQPPPTGKPLEQPPLDDCQEDPPSQGSFFF